MENTTYTEPETVKYCFYKNNDTEYYCSDLENYFYDIDEHYINECKDWDGFDECHGDGVNPTKMNIGQGVLMMRFFTMLQLRKVVNIFIVGLVQMQFLIQRKARTRMIECGVFFLRSLIVIDQGEWILSILTLTGS